MAGKQHRVACRSAYADIGNLGARYGFKSADAQPDTDANVVLPDGRPSNGPFKYAPYIGAFPTPPLHWNVVPSSVEDTLRHHLKFRLSVVSQRAIAAFQHASGFSFLSVDHRFAGEHWRNRGHDRHDALASLLGLTPSRAQGWVRVVSTAVSICGSTASDFLEPLYWYTRLTSTGLSLKGTVLLATQNIALAAMALGVMPGAGPPWFARALSALVAGVYAWLQLRAVLPYTWDRGLKRVPPTKRERLSARRDLTYAQMALVG